MIASKLRRLVFFKTINLLNKPKSSPITNGIVQRGQGHAKSTNEYFLSLFCYELKVNEQVF